MARAPAEWAPVHVEATRPIEWKDATYSIAPDPYGEVELRRGRSDALSAGDSADGGIISMIPVAI